VIQKITIAIPTLDGQVTSAMALFLASICRSKNREYRPAVVVGCGPVEYARNLLVEEFLRNGDDAIWFIDADMLPGPKTASLLGHAEEADIVTGRAIALGLDAGQEGPRHCIAAFDAYGEEAGFRSVSNLVTEPVPVIACGMACTLVHRRVFERVPWFRRQYGPRGEVRMGEDLCFSHDAHLAGYRILYVPGALIGHQKSIDLSYVETAADRAYAEGRAGR